MLEDQECRSDKREIGARISIEEHCIDLIGAPPQVRLANIGGDVLAIGGMALDPLDTVEQVSDKQGLIM